VLAASYEAKASGSAAACRGGRRANLCPQLTFVGGHFEHYQRAGRCRPSGGQRFTPLVERISIDEAFADVAAAPTSSVRPPKLRGHPPPRAGGAWPSDLRRRARAKHLAKIASQVANPRAGGCRSDTELEFFTPAVELMWGVGPVTKVRLAEIGVLTIGQLAKTPGWSLERLLGPAAGEKLAALAWNRDHGNQSHHGPDRPEHSRRSAEACRKSALFRPTLLHLADRIGTRIRAKSKRWSKP